MRNYAPWLGAVALLTVCASAHAQMKDAAELLPAQTLACVELRQPARLSREVAALVKGSALEDLPRQLAKKRAENENDRGFRYSWQTEMLGMLSMFLSPEMLDEAARIRGGFIALTGFAKDGTPEVVGVLQSGGSNFPGMYMRGFLSFSRPRLVGEVEGVSLFREVSYVYTSKPVGGPGGPPQMERRENGPVLGQMPGLLLFGSSVDSLKEVILRAKGKSADVALASVRAFKDAAALRERPGLFIYADMAALEAQLDEHTRQVGHPLGRGWAILKTILGKETARNLTASLTLFNGNLEWQMRANLNGKTDSPLLGLLPDTAVRRELLHFAPKDALLALAGGLGEGEKRWKTLLNLLDALDRFGGHGEANRPSKVIGELEEKLNLHIGKDVAAQLSGAGLVVHPEWGRDANRWMLLLRAVDAGAADKLEKHGLPRLLSLGGAEIRQAIEEEVQGQRIKTVPNKGALSLHYGRRGSVFALGPDRDFVAASLAAGGKKEGLLGETKTAEAVKEIDERAVMVGVVSPTQLAVDLFTLMRQTVARREMPMKKIAVAPGGAPAAPQPPPQPPKESAEEAKIKQELRKAFEPLPPLTFHLNRQPDVLLLEMRPVAMRRVAPRLLDVWIESLVKGMNQEAGGINAIAPAPAVKTPAPPAKR